MAEISLKEKISNLPKLPGVYLFKNSKGKIIYVGKAKRLKDRVKSYFAIKIETSTKTAALVRQIADFDFIEVETELEALILEAELVKRYHPKYNVVLKDDKSALHIVVRNEMVKKGGKKIKLPRVLIVRATDLKKEDSVYGPYPYGNVARYLLRSLRKMFRFRNCSSGKFQKYQSLGVPCFYGHIGLCSAPCTDSGSILDYRKDINRLKKVLEGRSPRLFKSLEKEMFNLSKQERYEEAAKKRDLLQKMRYVTRTFRDPGEYMDNPYLVEDLISQSLDELVSNIPNLGKIPKRIECYDISNLFGKDATGAMVVAINGRVDKRESRRFRIRFKHTPDDYEMMREVLRRRFKREKSKNKNLKKWGLPDLLVVDGGKGQVSAVLEVIDEYKLDIVVVGLSKRYETVVLADFSEVTLPRSNQGLRLLQKLRDEAHRFAKRYHRQLRLRRIRG